MLFRSGLKRMITYRLREKAGIHCPIHFIDGNHEDHPALRAPQAEQHPNDPFAPVKIAPEVYWMPRGSSMTLPDGRTTVFLGGAKSVDAPLRHEGHDWFPEEVLTRDVLDGLPEAADVVFSHTAPTRFNVLERFKDSRPPKEWDLSPDTSMDVLDEAFDRLRPRLWYFSHFHLASQGTTDGCRWFELDMAGHPNWWTWLEE